MSYREFKKASKTDPVANLFLKLWLEGKAPLFPLIEAYKKIYE